MLFACMECGRKFKTARDMIPPPAAPTPKQVKADPSYQAHYYDY